MSSQKPPTIIEIIEQGRIHVLSTQANANTASISSYDAIANLLVQFTEKYNDQAVEIQRLQELLRKNNIQFTLPVEPVKLPENMAVVPEPQVETPPTSQS